MNAAYTRNTRAEDKAPQGCDLSAAASADSLGRLYPSQCPNSLPESAKSPGVCRGHRCLSPDKERQDHHCLRTPIASYSSLTAASPQAASPEPTIRSQWQHEVEQVNAPSVHFEVTLA